MPSLPTASQQHRYLRRISVIHSICEQLPQINEQSGFKGTQASLAPHILRSLMPAPPYTEHMSYFAISLNYLQLCTVRVALRLFILSYCLKPSTEQFRVTKNYIICEANYSDSPICYIARAKSGFCFALEVIHDWLTFPLPLRILFAQTTFIGFYGRQTLDIYNRLLAYICPHLIC